MAIRGQQKQSSLAIVPGVSLDLNPFAQGMGTARVLRNWTLERGRLARKPFACAFFHSTVSGLEAWRISNFKYTRNGAPESKLIIFGNNGRVYKWAGDSLIEIFPGNTSFSALSKKPFVGQLSNRLFFSDGVSSYVYDGRSVRVWGLARSTTAPAVTAANVAGSIVAATGVKGCFTWVVLDEAGNRVHESTRSNINASFVVVGGADDAITLDVTGLTAPSGATHWSGYISELDGSEVYRRTNTTLLTTLTYTATAFPSSVSPKAPIRNDPPPPSTVGCTWKNRIILRDDANPSQFYFSALGEVKGLLNGAPDESFCGYGANSISDISNSDFVTDREIRAFAEHENALFLFSETTGYALVGELNLLDNRSPRSVVKLQQFTEGCLNQDSIASTPYGLAWMTPGKRVWLASAGTEIADIGDPLQANLDKIIGADSDKVLFTWYSENGRQWLIVGLRTATVDDVNGTVDHRAFIYDFSTPFHRPTKITPEQGSWFEWLDDNPVAIGSWMDTDGYTFLFFSTSDEEFTVQDLLANPATVGSTTGIIGKCHCGTGAVFNSPAATLRTGLLLPSGNQWSIGEYVELVTGNQRRAGSPSSGTLDTPVITSWIDTEDPDSPGTGITLSLDTALTSGDSRAWLIPQATGAGNNVNVGGAFGKQFVFQLQYGAGTNGTYVDAVNGQNYNLEAIYKVAFAFIPQKEMAR